MLPNREGRWKARITERGVADTGPNNLCTFTASLQLVQELVENDWADVEDDLNITGYFYLEKRDRTLNTATIENLKRATGWDGRDAMWLQDTDLSGILVQVTTKIEEYKGVQKVRIGFIYAEDAKPAGVAKADDTARRSITTRLGAKLRANAGGTPMSPSSKSPVPAAPAKPAAATAANRSGEAWSAFVAATPTFDENGKATEWFRILEAIHPGKKQDELTDEEWGVFISTLHEHLLPF